MAFFANEARFSQIRCTSGNVLSKTKSVTPKIFHISEISNSSTFTGKIFRKKSMLQKFCLNILNRSIKTIFVRQHFPSKQYFSLTKPDLLRFRCFSGHVLSKMKLVTTNCFTFLTSLKFSENYQCKKIFVRTSLNQEHLNSSISLTTNCLSLPAETLAVIFQILHCLQSNCKHIPADGIVHAQKRKSLPYWGGDRKNVWLHLFGLYFSGTRGRLSEMYKNDFNSGALYSYRNETHELIFSWLQHCSWARMHDDDGVVQDGGRTPNNRLTEACSLGLPCTSLILDIHVMIN